MPLSLPLLLTVAMAVSTVDAKQPSFLIVLTQENTSETLFSQISLSVVSRLAGKSFKISQLASPPMA